MMVTFVVVSLGLLKLKSAFKYLFKYVSNCYYNSLKALLQISADDWLHRSLVLLTTSLNGLQNLSIKYSCGLNQ